jgi:cytochrome P450
VLTWTLYLLGQNPAVAAKLHAEVDQVLAGHPPTLEDLARLPYTEMVIKEGMRIFPPVWSIGRQTTEATELAGYPIRRNNMAIIPMWSVHRDARHFPEPEKFIPERFSPENESTLHKYAYLPFGGGPRICIGNAFAMMEARLILASIVQRYQLDLVAGHRVVPEPLVTLRPRYGMRMKLTARKDILTPVLS